MFDAIANRFHVDSRDAFEQRALDTVLTLGANIGPILVAQADRVAAPVVGQLRRQQLIRVAAKKGALEVVGKNMIGLRTDYVVGNGIRQIFALNWLTPAGTLALAGLLIS